jgi:excisionase family DNA binding protein
MAVFAAPPPLRASTELETRCKRILLALPAGQRSTATDAVDGDDRLTWDVPEAARRLGVSTAFYYRAASRGELPVMRLGRRLVVPKAALLRLLNDSTTTAAGGEVA